MSEKKTPQTIEGIDAEIASLHMLLNEAMQKSRADMELADLIKLIDSVGKNSLCLARMLKIRVELVDRESGPSALLHQTLLELEEEWPELKQLAASYPLSIQGSGVSQPSASAGEVE